MDTDNRKGWPDLQRLLGRWEGGEPGIELTSQQIVSLVAMKNPPTMYMRQQQRLLHKILVTKQSVMNENGAILHGILRGLISDELYASVLERFGHLRVPDWVTRGIASIDEPWLGPTYGREHAAIRLSDDVMQSKNPIQAPELANLRPQLQRIMYAKKEDLTPEEFTRRENIADYIDKWEDRESLRVEATNWKYGMDWKRKPYRLFPNMAREAPPGYTEKPPAPPMPAKPPMTQAEIDAEKMRQLEGLRELGKRIHPPTINQQEHDEQQQALDEQRETMRRERQDIPPAAANPNDNYEDVL